MKSSQDFKKAIQAYLDLRAKTDKLFAVSYAKTNKIVVTISSVKLKSGVMLLQ